MDDSSPGTKTPPHRALKRHCTQPAASVLYGKCLKNHAAGIGGLALDGCGEFMPSSSLKCAACGCHRNFHRREIEDPSAAHFISFRYPQSLFPRSLTASRSRSPISADEYTQNQQINGVNRGKGENPSGRKRFRSKFSEAQKEKMKTFAEKLGWKIQKMDEREVEEFCNEVGVSKGVFKVWIHNNKMSIRNCYNINNNNNNADDKNLQNEGITVAHLHVSNGSSSSS